MSNHLSKDQNKKKTSAGRKDKTRRIVVTQERLNWRRSPLSEFVSV
jgi:hypothetical protein